MFAELVEQAHYGKCQPSRNQRPNDQKRGETFERSSILSVYVIHEIILFSECLPYY